MNGAFTVAICHLNQGSRIEPILLAVLADLKSRDARLLLVDNGSTDGSLAIFERIAETEPRFRFIREERRGVYYARRAAILAAETPILIFLDDDAMPKARFFERILRHFAEDPTVGIVGGRVDPVWDAPLDWLPPKLANEFAADPALPRSGTTAARFPCFPTGAALALRLGECARLFCGEARAADYPLGRRAGDPSRGIEPSELGGEDTDLCMIYAANGWRVLFDNEARIALHVPPERLTPQWFIARYFAEGRTRIRLLRISGQSAIGRQSLGHVCGIVPFALMALAGSWLGRKRALWIQAYFAKARGAWYEILFGWRGAPFPFKTTKVRGASPGA